MKNINDFDSFNYIMTKISIFTCSLLHVITHQGIILAEVVHRVLEEYDLTQKVSKHEFYLPYFQS